MAVITALRERPRGRVEVDLDGRSWRLVPADAVVRTGLAVGRALDRETARALGRELRRSEALGVAAARAPLPRLLAQPARGAARGARHRRPRWRTRSRRSSGPGSSTTRGSPRAGREVLAGRGFGDAAIRFSLEGEGLAPRSSTRRSRPRPRAGARRRLLERARRDAQDRPVARRARASTPRRSKTWADLRTEA